MKRMDGLSAMRDLIVVDKVPEMLICLLIKMKSYSISALSQSSSLMISFW